MPAAPMMTPGLMGPAPVAGAAPSADMTGLGGLFGALMGHTGMPTGGMQTLGDGFKGLRVGMAGEAVPQGAADMLAAMTAGGFDMQAFLASQGLIEQVVQLDEGGGEITVQGEAATVQAFVVQVKQIYQSVVVEGGLTLGEARSSSALAGALQKLGMDAETAMNVAERIETMLKLVEQYQAREKGLDDTTAGTLVAMMLAVMGQAANAPADAGGEAVAFRLQITSVEQTVTVTSRTLTVLRSSGDVARDLLAAEAPPAPAAPVQGTVQALEVSVTRDGETARIGMVLPEVEAAKTLAPVTVESAAETAPDIAHLTARAPVTVQPVKPEALVEAPEGEIYYTLKADEDGVEMVEAVKPLPPEGRTLDTLPEAPRPADVPLARAATAGAEGTQPAPQVQAQAAATADAGRSYAAEIEALQGLLDKAQVAKQVAVQMMPLLEQGGGTVRLQLNPVELGQITVELHVRDGRVEGAIAATEPRVVEHLARELHSLRQGLAEAGLKVSDQGINLMLSNPNGGGQFGHSGGQHAPQETASRRHGQGAAGEGGAAESAPVDSLAGNLSAWVSPDRMLDVNV